MSQLRSRLSALLVVAAFVLPALATLLPPAGALTQSVNVLFVGDHVSRNGGGLFHTDPAFAPFAFANIDPGQISAATLAGHDTVVLNVASSAMACSTSGGGYLLSLAAAGQ